MSPRAFTLIELLAVISIIAILAAVLFPAFAQAKVAAKQATCFSNIRQLTVGVMLYANDNDDAYPMGAWGYELSGPGKWSRWYIDIFPYTRSQQIRNCPLNPFQVPDSVPQGTDIGINFSVSAWMGAQTASALTTPANLVLLSDAAQLDFLQDPTSPDNMNPAAWAKHATGPTQEQVVGPYVFYPPAQFAYEHKLDGTNNQFRRPYAVHNGFVDIGFCDGHERAIDIRALIGPMPRGFALDDPRNVWANP